MVGVQVDGRSGPVLLEQSINDDWKVTYHFGRTVGSNQLRVVKVVVEPYRHDGVIPDEQGMTATMLKRLNLTHVRRYMDLNGFIQRAASKKPDAGKAKRPGRHAPGQ